MTENSTICAVLVNEKGQILSYTCQPTISQCEEFCTGFFPAWDTMKGLGCVIVQSEITLLEVMKELPCLTEDEYNEYFKYASPEKS